MHLPPGESVGFWNWSEEANEFSLDTDAVIRNAIDNMRRLEEQATTHVVVDYLRSIGYIVIGPEDEG
jgi:hypothetical protein